MDKKTILVVDDSAVMRHLNAAVLEGAGYRVLLAEDGKAALAQVCKEPIHLVLTDWTMVPMDGCELTRQLRSRPKRPAPRGGCANRWIPPPCWRLWTVF